MDAEEGVGSLAHLENGTLWYSLGDKGGREDVFYYFVGHGRDFPTDSLVSIELIRKAIKEFLTSGGERPTCVNWQPCRAPAD